MYPSKLPYLPTKLVEIILEEAFPGLRKHPPRIAPSWLVRLVGEDALAELDATPAHDYRNHLCALQCLVFVPLAWTVYARLSLPASAPPTWIRALAAVSYLALTAGADPWAASLDGLLFLADEERDVCDAGTQAEMMPARWAAGQRSRTRPWSDRLRARYRLLEGDSKALVRFELCVRSACELVLGLYFAGIVPATELERAATALLAAGLPAAAVAAAPRRGMRSSV